MRNKKITILFLLLPLFADAETKIELNGQNDGVQSTLMRLNFTNMSVFIRKDLKDNQFPLAGIRTPFFLFGPINGPAGDWGIVQWERLNPWSRIRMPKGGFWRWKEGGDKAAESMGLVAGSLENGPQAWIRRRGEGTELGVGTQFREWGKGAISLQTDWKQVESVKSRAWLAWEGGWRDFKTRFWGELQSGLAGAWACWLSWAPEGQLMTWGGGLASQNWVGKGPDSNDFQRPVWTGFGYRFLRKGWGIKAQASVRGDPFSGLWEWDGDVGLNGSSAGWAGRLEGAVHRVGRGADGVVPVDGTWDFSTECAWSGEVSASRWSLGFGGHEKGKLSSGAEEASIKPFFTWTLDSWKFMAEIEGILRASGCDLAAQATVAYTGRSPLGFRINWEKLSRPWQKPWKAELFGDDSKLNFQVSAVW